MGKDRCIRWERPYASTGYGHRSQQDVSFPTYDAEKDTSIGFDNLYTAEVEEREEGGAPRSRHGAFERMWYRTLWRDGDFRARPSWWVSADPDYDPRGIEDRSVHCPDTVATERSCRRALDRDVAARPPIVTVATWGASSGEGRRSEIRKLFDKIAPTGPWECVEYEDE